MAEFKIQIDADEEKMNIPLNRRETIALMLLYLMFKLVYRAKYAHQFHVIDEMLFDRR